MIPSGLISLVKNHNALILQFHLDVHCRYETGSFVLNDLVSMYSRTNSFKYSYFIRIINEWNSLPNDIKESVSISSFKRKVIAFLGNT